MSTNPCNIYLVGAQCTGKTTLANALSAHFEHSLPPESRPGVIKEVARTVLVKHKFTAEDIVSSPDRCLLLQTLILEAQAQAERECPDSGERWFVADRSGADPIVYAVAYMSADAAIGGGGESLLETAAWTQLRGRLAPSLIVLCEAGMEWLIDDGVRLMPKNMDEWITFHRLFCQFLDEQSLRYVVLPRHMVDIQNGCEPVEGPYPSTTSKLRRDVCSTVQTGWFKFREEIKYVNSIGLGILGEDESSPDDETIQLVFEI